MAHADALFELVHSLTRGEKKKFSTLARRNGIKKKPNYLVLFDALLSMQKWDSAVLKNKVAGSFPSTALPYEKNYLFNMLLDSLLHQHREHPDIYLGTLLNRSRILLEKGRVESSLKILQVADKLAAEQERRTVRLEILELRTGIASQFGNAQELLVLAEQEGRIIKEQENIRLYNHLLGELIQAAKDYTYSRNESQLSSLKKVMDNHLLQAEAQALSLPSKILYHHTHGYFNHLIKRRDRVKECNRSIVHLLDAHPEYTRVHLSDYLSAISNLLSDALFVKSREDADDALARLEAFHIRYPDATELIVESHRQLYLEARLRVFNQRGEFSVSASLLSEAELVLKSSVLVKPHRRMNLTFHSALALFGVGKFKECLRWLQNLADIPEVPFGAAVYYSMGMFLRLMTLLELGRPEVIEQQTRSFAHFLESRSLLRSTEKYLLGFFNKTASLSVRERAAEFKNCQETLEKYFSDSFELPMVHALDFLWQWATRKAETQPAEPELNNSPV